ncbi:ATP-binding protein [Agrobacterium rhizogenes]|nr:ATP-binding protein [Rhizobium rhizogenes]NTF91625.1 ATP-binding protein [Rhizobium rhizogenes]
MISASKDIILRQEAYAFSHKAVTRHGLTIDEAFIRGIRHIGYRSNLHAIAELIDNSIQAYAQRIDLVFGYADDGSAKKPNRIAIIDDGHGMPAAMMRLAMMWGGTHREDDREGLGRYGYGLPCAAVSIARCFRILSKLDRAPIFEVCLDLDDLELGSYRAANGLISLPDAQPAELPDFVSQHIQQHYPQGWRSGTIVVLEKLDRVEWTTALGMRTNLLRHLGVTYHKISDLAALYVDGTRVRPVDPLFLTPSADYFGLDDDRAVPLEPVTLSITNPASGRDGLVTLRYSWLPPTFGALDKTRDAVGLNANQRFPILKDYHGIIFSRNGRLIDVQNRLPWTVFINNDRYIRVEIEFSATLDELFGVTTSKQQVSVTAMVWDALRQAGIHKAIEQLRGKVKQAKSFRFEAVFRAPVPKPLAAVVQKRCLTEQAPKAAAPLHSLLVMDGVGGLAANQAHPLFNGSAGAMACAHALQKLVNMLANQASSTGTRAKDEYGDLLTAWCIAAWPDQPDV